jgi:AMP-binding enzyme C-terminal domain
VLGRQLDEARFSCDVEQLSRSAYFFHAIRLRLPSSESQSRRSAQTLELGLGVAAHECRDDLRWRDLTTDELDDHPAVAQVAVIGIPHHVWGEQVHAIVVLHPGTDVTADELKTHARETIAGFKVPKTLEFRVEPLPLSGALKPLKRELRAPYWQGHERAVH